MSTFTTPFTFSSGTTIQSSQVNSNFAYIASFFNTPSITNGNIAVGAAIAPTKLDLTAEIPVLRATGLNCVTSGLTGDTIPRLSMTSDLGIQFGPGVSGALDLSIQRIDSAMLGVFNATTTLKSLAMNSIYLKTATNYLIHTPATIATAARTVTHPDPGANVDLVYKTSGATATLGGIAYGAAAHTLNFSAAGTTGQAVISGGTGAPTIGTLGISGGGTNNASLGVSALGIIVGDGTKLAQIVGTAGQEFRVNAGGTAIEAFTASTGSSFTIATKTTDYNVSDGANYYYRMTTANQTATLPASPADGSVRKFKMVGAFLCTFAFNGAETINHANGVSDQSLTLGQADGVLELIAVSGGWDET